MTVRSLDRLLARLSNVRHGNEAADLRDLTQSSFGPYKVLLDSAVIGSSVSAVDFTGIDQSYADLLVECLDLVSVDSSEQDFAQLNLGGSASIDTGSNYTFDYTYGGFSDSDNDGNTPVYIQIGPAIVGAGDVGSPHGAHAEFLIRNYASSSYFKHVITSGSKGGAASGPSARNYACRGTGVWRATTAVERVRITADGGNLTAGTVKIYGLGVA